MAFPAKQPQNVRSRRETVIPGPHCGMVCEAVMSPLYPAVKSNLCPALKIGQKSDGWWLGIDLSGLKLLLCHNGPQMDQRRVSSLRWGTDATRLVGWAQTATQRETGALTVLGCWGPHRSPAVSRQSRPRPKRAKGLPTAKRVRWGEEGQGSVTGNAQRAFPAKRTLPRRRRASGPQ